MKVQNWNDEAELWEFIQPKLRGWWRRLEMRYPDGFCDSVGLYQNETIWLEHKVGKPSRALFRPSQIEFAHQCMRHGVPYYTCFGHLRSVLIYRGLDFTEPVRPVWWIAPIQAPSATSAKGPSVRAV